MKGDYISAALFVSEEKAQKVFDELVTLVNLVVGAANTIAGKAMFDAIERVKATNLYRDKVRKNLAWAASLYYKYERTHTLNFGDSKQLFYDYLDSVEEDIQSQVDILRKSIKSVLDRNGQENTDLKSYVETARNLLGYACHVYDVQLETARKKAPYVNYERYTRPARLTFVMKRYEEAADLICKPKGIVIDLNDDKNCILAFRAIEQKITSEDFLNKAGYKALKLNPENVAKVAPEDMKMLEDRYKNS